jgi:hypothetical protein
MEKLRPHYPVGALAEALEVSPSGFHAHRHKPRRARRQRDAALRPLIAESFARSRKTYGPLRVQADLREVGERCGKNRIGRLMREQRLRPAQKRRFRPQTTEEEEGNSGGRRVGEQTAATRTRSPRTGSQKCPHPTGPAWSGRATLLTLRPPKAGFIWPLLSMAARAAAWPTIAATTCASS